MTSEITFLHNHSVKSVQARSFFLAVFSCIWTRKNSVYGHFSRSEWIFVPPKNQKQEMQSKCENVSVTPFLESKNALKCYETSKLE